MIEIYGNVSCEWCIKAKELCKQYNLKYEYKSLDKDTVLMEFMKKFPSARTVPQITWNGKYIGGYSELAEEITNTINNYGDGKI
jgi:glutaredoxin